MQTVLQPTVDELRRRGTPFSGLLYAGLAITSRGVRVIEFNARFGDPETQVVLARLKTPLAGVLLAAGHRHPRRPRTPLRWSDDAAVTVVIASHNYPDTPRTGDPIEGLAEVAAQDAPHAYVLHAGTRRDGEARSSARAAGCCPSRPAGTDLAQARARAYGRSAGSASTAPSTVRTSRRRSAAAAAGRVPEASGPLHAASRAPRVNRRGPRIQHRIRGLIVAVRQSTFTQSHSIE